MKKYPSLLQRASLERNDDGSVGLTLRDQQGRPRLQMGLDIHGQPTIQLLDAQGKSAADNLHPGKLILRLNAARNPPRAAFMRKDGLHFWLRPSRRSPIQADLRHLQTCFEEIYSWVPSRSEPPPRPAARIEQ